MEQREADMLTALGPGGTRELAQRALAYFDLCEDPPEQITHNVANLVGLKEVSEFFGTNRQTVGHWIAGRRGPGSFPEPLITLSTGPVWDLSVIEEWAKAHPDLVKSGDL